jgi:hypothetical protein
LMIFPLDRFAKRNLNYARASNRGLPDCCCSAVTTSLEGGAS